MSSKWLLQIEQLNVRRGEQVWEHQLNLKRGEIALVMGPSGCGKSTLLEALAGFVPIELGRIWVQGQAIENWPASKRPLSMLFQQQNFFEHLQVSENIRLGFPQAKPTQATWQKVLQACELLGVQDLLQRLPGALSGGQKQRLALIRSVLRPQPLLLLDEPFSALDDHYRQLATGWLQHEIQSSGRAALLVSHQEEDARRLADQRLVLQ